MIRVFKILASRLTQLKPKDILPFLMNSAFVNDTILIYKLELASVVEDDSQLSDGIVVRKGTPEDLDEIAKTLDPVPWEFQCSKFDGVADFFVAEGNEGIMHICWIYYKESHSRVLSLSDTDVEFKFALTLPAFRGTGLFPLVLNYMARYMLDHGYRRAFGCIEKNNHASIRSNEKAGFTKVATVNLRKLMGVQISRRLDTSTV